MDPAYRGQRKGEGERMEGSMGGAFRGLMGAGEEDGGVGVWGGPAGASSWGLQRAGGARRRMTLSSLLCSAGTGAAAGAPSDAPPVSPRHRGSEGVINTRNTRR